MNDRERQPRVGLSGAHLPEAKAVVPTQETPILGDDSDPQNIGALGGGSTDGVLYQYTA